MVTSRAGRKFVKMCTAFAAEVPAAAVPSALFSRYINLMASFYNDVVQFRKVECTMNILVNLFHWAGLNLSKIRILKRLRTAYERDLHYYYFKLVWMVQKSFIKWHPDFADSDKRNNHEPNI